MATTAPRRSTMGPPLELVCLASLPIPAAWAWRTIGSLRAHRDDGDEPPTPAIPSREAVQA